MTYVMSDLHGQYQKYKAMLEEIHFKDSDVMYVLGNFVDYGDEPMELLEDLSYRDNILPVAGSHDYLAARMLDGFSKMLAGTSAPDENYKKDMMLWMQMGGQNTFDAFRELDDSRREGILDYLSDMALYETTEIKGQEYILVSSGIAGYDPDEDLDSYSPEDFFKGKIDPSKRMDPNRIFVAGTVKTGGTIQRGNGCILVNCGDERLGCLCLETGKEYYI